MEGREMQVRFTQQVVCARARRQEERARREDRAAGARWAYVGVIQACTSRLFEREARIVCSLVEEVRE